MPPARRRRCHFLPAFSPTTTTTHPPRLTDQPDRTRRASPFRSLLSLRLHHAAPTQAQPASDRPPPAASCTSATATRLCRVGDMYFRPPPVRRCAARDDHTHILTPPIVPAHAGTRTRRHLTHQPASAEAPQRRAAQQSERVSGTPTFSPHVHGARTIACTIATASLSFLAAHYVLARCLGGSPTAKPRSNETLTTT